MVIYKCVQKKYQLLSYTVVGSIRMKLGELVNIHSVEYNVLLGGDKRN